MNMPEEFFVVRRIVVLVGALFVCGAVLAKPVVERVSLETGAAQQLVKNPGFEEGEAASLPGWFFWRTGYEAAAGAGRDGGCALRCVQAVTTDQHGAGQTVELNQSEARTIFATGWSRAENVDGSPNPGYSIYLDMEYMDGTFLYAQASPFSTGTHTWELRKLVIPPGKAVRRATVYPLFRGHTGTVYFDDFALGELKGESDVHFFEGVPVRSGSKEIPDFPVAATLHTSNGLDVKLGEDNSSIAMNGHVLGRGGPVCFVRDATADSDFLAPDSWKLKEGEGTVTLTGNVDPLDLILNVTLLADGTHIEVTSLVQDTRGEDRAVTLYFAVPVMGQGWTWSDDTRRSVPAEKGVFCNTVRTGAGATGLRSRYPLAALSKDREGLALAVPLDEPRHHRFGFDASNGLYFAAFDLGLSKATAKFPGKAMCRVLVYPFEGQHRFRGALARYYSLFPESFVKRAPVEGLWMAFTDIATVKGWEDFGFAYKEGINNVPWDARHGILSFVYTEPMTTWLALPPEIPRTYDAVMEYLNTLGTSDKPEDQRRASKTITSSLHGPDGRSILSIENAPWCNGAVFALNPNPEVPTTAQHPINQAQNEFGQIESAIQQHDRKSLGDVEPARVDGTYIDSYEFWNTTLNYNRTHFASADLPLVYDAMTCQPGILTIFSTFEFQRELARRMHAQNRLMMANGVLHVYDFPAAYLDVLGTETNWFPQGKWQPLPDDDLCFRRAMCYQKPYCFLMNTHYADLTLELTERYMQRCLFYGMFPGFFSENAATNCYFATPEWYEPARSLFRKYVPLIRRIAKAGWKPITFAKTDNEKLYVERFGMAKEGEVFFTVMNETGSPERGMLKIDLAGLGWGEGNGEVRDLTEETVIHECKPDTMLELPLDCRPYSTKLFLLTVINPA
ncbi:MAG TPA: hypothetical protein PLI09_05195 [Candidatus Hydrogenedentes bacterium]|nr:hypothetical protein [Candidatus Hydrogenedentota bacterium]